VLLINTWPLTGIQKRFNHPIYSCPYRDSTIAILKTNEQLWDVYQPKPFKMKKLALLLTVSVLFFTSCKSKWEKGIDQYADNLKKREDVRWKKVIDAINANPGKYDSLAAQLGLKFDSQKKILTDSIKPAFASWYISNYRKSIPITTTADSIALDSTESVWVDREVIAAFAKSIADGTNDIDGMRIYFAKYPSKIQISIDPKIDPENADRNTLIFVATKNKADYYDEGSIENGLFIYDYNSLCPRRCEGNILGEHSKRLHLTADTSKTK
jgi:ribosomal protein S27AE